MLSRLKPDSATMVGLLTAAGVVLIYQNALPSIADIRVAAPNDEDLDTSRKHAAWVSAALVGVVFVVARDLNSYIISGAALVGVDYLYKHNNAFNPHSGKLEGQMRTSITTDDNIVHPMPQYEESA